MQRYIALLRGINVGGHRPLKMDELRAMFTSMNFKNVTTYIQSGNVIFEGPDVDTGRLAEQLSRNIEDTFGYDLPVIVRTVEQVREAYGEGPFVEKDSWKGYISFLPDYPNDQKRRELEEQSSSIEKFKTGQRLVYSLVDKSASEKPQFSNSFIERQLDMPATTRNLRTVRKLLSLSED